MLGVRLTWLAVVLAAFLAWPLAGRGGEAPSGAVVLFNGHDLEGWVVEGVGEHPDGRPVWSIAEEMIRCDGRGFGFLRYEKAAFDDFRFHLEFRMQPRCNTGVGFRTRDFDPERSWDTRPSNYSYEIQLVDDAGQKPTPHSSGSLYRYLAPRVNAMRPAGEWNEMEITAVGPRLKVVLNDEVLHDVDQSTIEAIRRKPLMGSVCVQNHGGKVDFRNLWVEPLKAPGDVAESETRAEP